jgi:Domain of unknown function (DUF222)
MAGARGAPPQGVAGQLASQPAGGVAVQLAQLPPGPELARVLESVRAGELSDDAHRHLLVAACARQVAHDQALLLAAMQDTAGASGVDTGDPLAVGPRGESDEFGPDQLAFTLRWSRLAVHSHLNVADELRQRLPVVFAWLLAGRIDLPKARAFADVLVALPVPAARAVAAALLPEAQSSLTVGQLRRRLEMRVKLADPTRARERTRHSLTQRRIYQQLDADGTATLAGVCLPPTRAAAAADRIERLARAAHADGDTRTLDQLRADAMLALLSGAPFTLHPPTDQHTASADTQWNDLIAASRRPEPQPRPEGEAHVQSSERLDREPAPQAPPGPAAQPTPAGGPKPDEVGLSVQPGQGEPVAVWAGPPPQEPDPGHAYVLAGPADPIGAAGLGRDPLAVRDGAGQVDLSRTPTPDQPDYCVCGGVQPAPRRGVVELLIRLDTLMGLNDDPAMLGGWGPVVSDIARQVAFDTQANPRWAFTVTDRDGHVLHHGYTNRRPTATERDFVRARDRTCRAPGCSRPATWCDLDHRVEYAKGGLPHRHNLCCLCRRHHRLRHERGFTYQQVTPGSYRWRAPNGLTYHAPIAGELTDLTNHNPPQPRPGRPRYSHHPSARTGARQPQRPHPRR